MFGTQSEAAYEQRMLVEGLTYRDLQRLRVQYLGCGVHLVTGLLVSHCRTQHDAFLGYQ